MVSLSQHVNLFVFHAGFVPFVANLFVFLLSFVLFVCFVANPSCSS